VGNGTSPRLTPGTPQKGGHAPQADAPQATSAAVAQPGMPQRGDIRSETAHAIALARGGNVAEGFNKVLNLADADQLRALCSAIPPQAVFDGGHSKLDEMHTLALLSQLCHDVLKDFDLNATWLLAALSAAKLAGPRSVEIMQTIGRQLNGIRGMVTSGEQMKRLTDILKLIRTKLVEARS
jgi:hypothetical protein